MDNYNYPEGSDNEYAPWNEESIECPDCGSEEVTVGSGEFRCLDCGCEWSCEEEEYDPEDLEDWG